ncbi:Nicotinate dehydrogenase FAD-subunit [Botrimarina colliarenosi]|uniref:Nicotinate dehydrogenase FAD-subunit n=1 Tax=Botrimarina colliarenosi TaxID=2528001 RepID=A0A5C6AD57_9BACT|nr:FAD binding domain-containing protein [Botrimarina colliarenosi]TWT97894.1 Nicotinate dehydrogenase FAD-subunit [Botrimarina colliarenosi]
MRNSLVFYVNGDRHEVRGEAAGRTLSDYLRGGCGSPTAERLVGTKIACAEGDCGACTVLVGKTAPSGDRLDYQTIDACIAFIYQLDRRHVVTVEGLQEDSRLAPAQQAMVDCHGSQCGFCTPGFVMALQGLVEESDDRGPLADETLRLGLSGNLCRCTGYSQILDAGKRLDPARVDSVAKQYDPAPMLADFAALGDGPVRVNPRDTHQLNGHATAAPPVEVFLPSTLPELVEFRADNPDAKLVSGATDVGVQFNHGKLAPVAVISTTGVAELQHLEVVDEELVIGAAVPWSRVEAFAKHELPAYHAILTRFGSPQVRHAGTLVGNLANASPIADSIPFHYVAGSTLELASVGGRRDVPIEDFYLGYKQLDLRPDEVIIAVRTPLPAENVQLRLYKVSKRRDMDISTVTTAFWLELEGDLCAGARLAAGGVGPTVVRLPRAEEALIGRPLTLEAMRVAGRIAREEITPISDVRGGADYRLQLVENLFAKCWHEVRGNGILTGSSG